MNIAVVGFKADPSSPTGSYVEVLEDWGQPRPADGQPGPRVYVKQGRPQLVKLMARICNAQSFNVNCSQQPSG
jgi:hypothetical protein